MVKSKLSKPDLFTPLSDDEHDVLNAFLLDRGADQADDTVEDYDPDLDEGILDLSELDGFFTAIVSGPRAIMPSEWMPALWGDVEPVWENEKEFSDIFQLLTRFMNTVVSVLMDPEAEFEPIFQLRGTTDDNRVSVDEWCSGYMRGVGLNADEWEAEGETIMGLLNPILMFSTPMGWDELRQLDDDEIEEWQLLVAPAARQIHDFWLQQRSQESVSAPYVNESPRVGRNDPCPCGSGKKYKKCCLH